MLGIEKIFLFNWPQIVYTNSVLVFKTRFNFGVDREAYCDCFRSKLWQLLHQISADKHGRRACHGQRPD